jgi:hypothetical protein
MIQMETGYATARVMEVEMSRSRRRSKWAFFMGTEGRMRRKTSPLLRFGDCRPERVGAVRRLTHDGEWRFRGDKKKLAWGCARERGAVEQESRGMRGHGGRWPEWDQVAKWRIRWPDVENSKT